MKYTIIIAFLGLVACNQQTLIPPEIGPLTSTLFEQVKSNLDFSTMKKVIGKESVEVFMIQFKGDTNRVYATCSKGELLYERHITDANTGYVDLTKDGATVRMEFKNGIRTIAARTTLEDHGGTGFCQREKDEKYGDCFKAETDEFCDSFVSCLALATQPSVSILIGISCTCEAKK